MEKWGKAFTEMRNFATNLEAVEYHLPRGRHSRSFLENWRTAICQRRG